MSVYKQILNLDTVDVFHTTPVNDTTYFNLGYENIIEDSFTVYNSLGIVVPDDKYLVNFGSGDIKMDYDILPNDGLYTTHILISDFSYVIHLLSRLRIAGRIGHHHLLLILEGYHLCDVLVQLPSVDLEVFSQEISHPHVE